MQRPRTSQGGGCGTPDRARPRIEVRIDDPVCRSLVGTGRVSGRPSPPKQTPQPLLASQLTGEALAALQADGRFMPRLQVAAPGEPRLPGQEEAEQLATEFWRTFGSSYRGDVEARRGSPIDPAVLTACRASLLAESAWNSPPKNELTLFRAHIGPRWIVPLCNGASPQVLIGVAALVAELLPSGDFKASPELLNAAFSVEGVPIGRELALSAEQAAAAVAVATGARVSRVPRLMRADAPLSGWWTMWAVEVERPVGVRGASSHRERRTSTVFFGNLPAEGWRMAIADNLAVSAPDSIALVKDILRGDGRRVVVVRRRRNGLPSFARMEGVEVGGGQQP